MTGGGGQIAPTSTELQHAAVRGTIWTAFQAGLGIPLAVVANIVVARALGPREFGIVAALMTAYAIATSIANMGVSDATVQWGSVANAQGRQVELQSLIRRCAGYHFVVEVPLIVISTAVFLHDAGWLTQLAACMAAGVTMAIGTSAVAHVALSRTATAARVGFVINVLVQVAVVAVALASHSGAATWTARIAVAGIGPLILYFKLPAGLRRALLAPLMPRHWPAGFRNYALKAGVGALAATLVFSRSEIFVLQANGLEVTAGLFALAFGISAQLTAPVDALLGPMVPAAASLLATAPQRAGDALLRGLRFSALGSGALAALVIAPASALAPAVYGQRYAAVGSLFVALALVSCVQSLNNPVIAFMYGSRRVGSMLLINVLAFVVDIAVAIAVVPVLGAWGAVIANAAGQMLALGPALIVLHRELRLPIGETLDAMRGFAAGAFAAVAGWLIASICARSVPPGMAAGAALLASALIFVVIVRLPERRILTAPDFDLIVEVLPRRFSGHAIRAAAALRLIPAREQPGSHGV